LLPLASIEQRKSLAPTHHECLLVVQQPTMRRRLKAIYRDKTWRDSGELPTLHEDPECDYWEYEDGTQIPWDGRDRHELWRFSNGGIGRHPDPTEDSKKESFLGYRGILPRWLSDLISSALLVTAIPNISDDEVIWAAKTVPMHFAGANCAAIVVYTSVGITLNTLIDDAGNIWLPGPTVTDSTNGNQAAMFYLPNPIVGARHITCPFGNYASAGNGGITFASAKAVEFSNIATTSAIDGTGSGGTNASGTSWNTGAGWTTASAGDAIWSAYFQDGGSNITAFTAGSGQTLLDADIVDTYVPSASQWSVQASAGATSPAITVTTAVGVGLGIALKQSGGTPAIVQHLSTSNTGHSAPLASQLDIFMPNPMGYAAQTGIHIVGIQHQSVYNTTGSTTISWQCPCFGNLLVIAGSLSSTVSSVASTPSNTWATADSNYSNVGGVGSILLYAAAASTATTMTGTLVTSGDLAESTFAIYDIAGAATSPLGSHTNATAATSSNGFFNAVTLSSPSQANGLVICLASVNVGTYFGVNGLNNYWDFPTYPQLNQISGGTVPNALSEDNCLAHTYNSSTTAIAYVLAGTANTN
jgi:hypothetical protein